MKNNIIKQKTFRLLTVILIIGLLLAFAFLTPHQALAINLLPNPSSIELTSAKFFNNVFQANDYYMLVYEHCVYATNPTVSAALAFSVNLYRVDGVTLIASVPLNTYGYGVVGIYFNAASVVTSGITPASAYVVKIEGNSYYFSDPTGNNDSYTMDTVNDWVTHVINPSDYASDPLAQQMIYVAGQIQTAVPQTILYNASGNSYLLTTDGSTMFINATANINLVVADIFNSLSSTIILSPSPATYAYQTGTVNVGAQLGASTQNAFKGIAKYFLGDENKDQLVEAAWGMLLVMMVSSIVFLGTGSSTVALISSIPMVLIAVWVGAFPMVILWLGVAIIVLYMGYHLLLRGM